MSKKIKYNCLINATPSTVIVDTTKYFDKLFCESQASAIDNYFRKETDINKIIPTENRAEFNVLAYMVLLTIVSAVESYFREIIRKIINTDRISNKKCEEQLITFGAACIHEKDDMLPEAILEKYSFASNKNVVDAFRELLGIGEGELTDQIKTVLNEFSMVCQLRHCIIHRYGKLGTNNAIKLGLEGHKEFIEKPIKFDLQSLGDTILICHNTVKVVNNFLFSHLLDRLMEMKAPVWTWDYRKDKRLFNVYYETYYSNVYPPEPAVSVKDAYQAYKSIAKPLNRGKKK